LHDRICETIKAHSGNRPLFIFISGELLDAAISEQIARQGNASCRNRSAWPICRRCD